MRPKFQVLNQDDAAAWERWMEQPETHAFLDGTIDQCSKMAQVARDAVGYVVTRPHSDPDGRQPFSDGWLPVFTWNPRKQD